MSKLLAAVDDSAASAPVLAVAQWFGGLLDLEVVALHVAEDGSGATARATAEAAGVKFEICEGDPARTIRRAARDDDVLAIAMGARALPGNRVPAGHVALDVIRRVAKPVIVIPPDVRVPAGDRPLRLLAPVDTGHPSASALRRVLDAMHQPDLELVLLHVFDAQHMPMFANHGSGDLEMWCEELVRRTTPSQKAQARAEWRVGHPAHTILAVEHELDPDLVVLAWAGNLARGRAAVVKRLLAHATTPLLLVPVVGAATPDRRRSGEEVTDNAELGETKARTVEIAIEETPEGYTEAKASLVVGGDRRFGGWGRARRNPADPEMPRVGEELAAARALSDLAHNLVDEAARTIEQHEGRRARVHG
jgi:hypothetical protein